MNIIRWYIPNEMHSLRVVPPQFWQLCQKSLPFARNVHTWNLNSWHPELPTNAHNHGLSALFLKLLQFYCKRQSGAQLNCSTLHIHGRLSKLLPPLLSMIHIRRREWQSSSPQDGSLLQKRLLQFTMRLQPVSVTRHVRFGPSYLHRW